MSSLKNNKESPTLLIIGGSARCGKTTLARRFMDSEKYIGFSEDALMHIILELPLPLKVDDKKKIYKTYLERPRYLNKKTNLTSCPKDSFSSKIYDSMLELVGESKAKTLGELVIDVNMKLGSKHLKSGVFFSDIHIEFFAEQIWKKNENAKLLILTRDPISTIAASLYWQTFPQRTNKWRRNFIYRLTLWCVSAEIGRKLVNEYPERTYIENLKNETLMSNSYIKRHESGVILDNDDWFFDYDPKRKEFRTPDGSWSKMLNDIECRLILYLSNRWKQDFLQIEKMPKLPFIWRYLLIEKIFSSAVKWIASKPIQRHKMLRAMLFPLGTSKIFLQLLAKKIRG